MGKRGPKPVDIGLLNLWEFEWYKALHVLRDGSPLPGTQAVYAPPLHISRKQIRSWIERLKGMGEDEYLRINELAIEKIAGEKGEKINPTNETDSWVQRDWANGQKQSEIAELERYLNPSKIPLQAERRQLWNALWRAQTLPVLKNVCDQWVSLRDVRIHGLIAFPNHILANAREFLRMKKDKRFPKSDAVAVDESRLEYVARGMAGILANVSPMTGIERLRNMKHSKGGPLWRGVKLLDGSFSKGTESCQCWRCGLGRSRPAYKASSEAWWNGMALFMELAGARANLKQRDGGP
jgi:hypothetical protein